MGEKRKRCRPLTQYNRQLLNVIDMYCEATGITTVDLALVVEWARANGHLDLPRVDINKILARALARASRQEYLEDENGEPVRRRHAFKIQEGQKQSTFWFKMEEGTPDQMKLSMQQRRRGIAADVFQADRDVKYYNKNHNPGDPIEPDWDFNADVAEKGQSGEYDDTPPDDDEDD